MTLIPFGRRLRSLGRLSHVASVLTKHGFGWLAVRLHLDRYVPFRTRLLGTVAGPEDGAAGPSMAARVAAVLEELGPTYVKLGQVLGSRADLMPPAFIEEFRKLQDRVRPFPTAAARAEIVRQLGKPVEELFDDFGPEPFAAGSIGQAYKARTKDGRAVVVKVRRPAARDLLEADIDILHRLAEMAEHYVPEYRVLRPVMMVEEFATTVRREIDFIAEASNTQRFREAFAENPDIRIPRVLWNLTASGILTMEWLEGIAVHDAAAMAAAGTDRKRLAAVLTECFIRQYFEMGLFHADPHAGNLVVQPPAVLGILDFGQIGRMSDSMRSRLGTALIAAIGRDFDIVMDILDDLDALPEDVDAERLKADLSGLVDKYGGIPLKRLNLKDLFEEITGAARRHRVLLPRDFVLLGKSLVTMGGVALDLDPDTSIVEVVRPRIRSMMTDKVSPKRLLHQGMTSAYHLMALAEQGPRSLRQMARKIMRGRLQIIFRHDNLDRAITEIDRSSNRIAFSLIVASIIMSSAWLIQAKVGPAFMDIPLLGMIGFSVAGLLGVWLVIAILRSGRL